MMKMFHIEKPLRRVAVAGVAVPLLALAAMTPTAQYAEAQQVGTAAAVNPAAQARGSGGSRTVVIGQSIAHRERIQTTSAGSVQLLFLDKTSMTIGPNSDLAIDEYVYDPASNSGKLAATLSKGVMRFVGGQISHAGNAQITTPNAVVGIRGGVGIFMPNSIYIGYGEGSVQSGNTNLTLSAGDYIQTFGGGAPPTSPGPPPANFLSSVLASLQSQAGQGGGARASAGQVNQARTNATGSTSGNIATGNLQNGAPPVNTTNAASSVNNTIMTTAAATAAATETGPTTLLTGYTGGISRETHPNHPTTTDYLFGAAEYRSTSTRTQVNFFFNNGMAQFGSVDPNLPPSSVNLNSFDDLVGQVTALLPAVNANGTPISHSNGGQPLVEQSGALIEFKKGSQLTAAAQHVLGGAAFCDCEFTRWGFWTADVKHAGSSGLRESIDSFWVAGQLPDVGKVPSHGSASFAGHAVAQIQNGSQEYAKSGSFNSTVNFGTKTGTFVIGNLDNATYNGVIALFPNDPRYLAGVGLSQNERFAILSGNFFKGKSGPVGEMGGMLLLFGTNYKGGGVFLAKSP